MTQPIGYSWPAKAIDHVDRTNLTPTVDQHPKDHDDLERAVNAVLYCLGDNPQGTAQDVTARLRALQNVLAAVQTELGAVEASLPAQVLQIIQGLGLTGLTHYVHYQRSGADTWIVNHALGYDPLVAVVRDNPDQVILGFELTYAPDHMSLTLGFSQVITGRAILSN